ncbi:hypothetical protein ACNQO6_04325 [Acinetobacter calcoaceticus]|uniref:hypothetical protein n=1 Tax=Acinetobacter calcoaceticus TaxID=471 RepID=UPI002B31A88C|nr:hypothetical protein SB581_16140 [Acinetobacter baumannii]
MMLRVKQFLLGCLFGLITTYFILITGFGIYYGFSGMVGVALVSMFMHFTPFPYLLYLAGGLIFLFIPTQRFPHTQRQLWKWLAIASVVAGVLICLSEIAHVLGWLNAEFHLPRKPED